MDDFDVQGKERELDELLSEVKSLLEEDEPLREDPMEDAGLQDEASEGPMTADDVNIDFEKFYDDAAGFPDEGIYTPPTAYEQSKSAYQVARRAEYERMREAEREARDRQRVARDREEERVMRKLESRNRKTAETVKNPPRSDEEYAQWLYEHCAEYGFVLRYPADKTEITQIIYEPWHFRFVGKEAAEEMHDLGLCLEEYLESLAD